MRNKGARHDRRPRAQQQPRDSPWVPSSWLRRQGSSAVPPASRIDFDPLAQVPRPPRGLPALRNPVLPTTLCFEDYDRHAVVDASHGEISPMLIQHIARRQQRTAVRAGNIGEVDQYRRRCTRHSVDPGIPFISDFCARRLTRVPTAIPPVLTIRILTSVVTVAGGDETPLSIAIWSDASQYVAAILSVADLGLGRRIPAEIGSRHRPRRASGRSRSRPLCWSVDAHRTETVDLPLCPATPSRPAVLRCVPPWLSPAGRAASKIQALGGSATHDDCRDRRLHGLLVRLLRRRIRDPWRRDDLACRKYRVPSSPFSKRLALALPRSRRVPGPFRVPLPTSWTLGTTTTPSSSATTRSPGQNLAPAQITDVFTFAIVSLTVPCAQTALDHTGNFMSVNVAMSLYAGVDD